MILHEFEDLKKALNLLKASTQKFLTYNTGKTYTPGELEYYDSLSFRFEKSVELTLNFFKGLEIFLESRSSDTLRDRLLEMQKLELIEDIEFWMEARLLRNKLAHAYLPEQLKDIYEEIIRKSEKIFITFEKLKEFLLRQSHESHT